MRELLISYPSLSELRGCCCESKIKVPHCILLPSNSTTEIHDEKVSRPDCFRRSGFFSTFLQQSTSVPSRGKTEQLHTESAGANEEVRITVNESR